MNPSVPNPSSLSEEFSVFSLDTFFCALTYYMCVCVWSHSVVSDSLRPCGLHPARLLCPWDSPGKNTGVGCHFLLQGIFPTQGSNPGLLLCRQMLYPLSHQGSLNYHYIYENGTRIDFTKILRKVSRAYLSRGEKMSYLGARNGGK